MPTSKPRLNLTLPRDTAIFLKKIALRDDVPQAAKAVELIEKALELEEDEYWSKVAERNEKKTKKFISHKEFWSKVL